MNVVVLARWAALPAERQANLRGEVIAGLRERGLTVGVVDASMGSSPLLDERKGRDTAQHAKAWHAGAQEVLLAQPDGAALFTRFEASQRQGPDLPGLVALLDPRIDWVFAFGADDAGAHKLECWTPEATQLLLYPEDPYVVAMLGDPALALPEATLRELLGMHDAPALVDWLLGHAHRFDWSPQLAFARG